MLSSHDPAAALLQKLPSFALPEFGLHWFREVLIQERLYHIVSTQRLFLQHDYFHDDEDCENVQRLPHIEFIGILFHDDEELGYLKNLHNITFIEFLPYMSSFMHLKVISMYKDCAPLMTFIGLLLNVWEGTITCKRFTTLLIFIGFLFSVYSFVLGDDYFVPRLCHVKVTFRGFLYSTCSFMDWKMTVMQGFRTLSIFIDFSPVCIPLPFSKLTSSAWNYESPALASTVSWR